jgi:hypothetical protein
MDMLVLAAFAVLVALIAAQAWYHRWCDRNGVARAAGSTSMDGVSSSDDDGGD